MSIPAESIGLGFEFFSFFMSLAILAFIFFCSALGCEKEKTKQEEHKAEQWRDRRVIRELDEPKKVEVSS